jgi:L-ascorbate metabolism protein UlaG (beta-lactamase superfamily)
MQLTYLGHSCFMLQTAGKTLIFDPFIKSNPLAASISFDALTADYILVSHGHEDHTADLIALAQQTGAKVIANWEIHAWLNKHGVTNTHPMNIGGKWMFDFGTVNMVFAAHSSSMPDGTYGGTAAGFVIESDGKAIYYAGDSALTNDMKIVGAKYMLDAALLPIGDNFTMDYQDACEAALWVNCNHVIAMHFDTFGFIKVNHEQAQAHFTANSRILTLPTIGGTITI